jgi:hypothetical protein
VSPSGSNREMMGPRLGAARLCDAGHGEAWQGVAGLCEAGRCRAWRGLARPGAVRQGEAEQGMDSGVGEILPGVRTPGMVLTGPGEATYGRAWQGVARYGKAWPCAARRSKARRGAARHGEARLGEAGLGKVRQGLAPLGVAIPGRAVRCMAWLSKARLGPALRGRALHGEARRCKARQTKESPGRAGRRESSSEITGDFSRCQGKASGQARRRRAVLCWARLGKSPVRQSKGSPWTACVETMTRQGRARHCVASPGWAWQGMVTHGGARHGSARRSRARQGKAVRGKAGRSTVRRG